MRTKSVDSNESGTQSPSDSDSEATITQFKITEEYTDYRKLGAPQVACSFEAFEAGHQDQFSQAFSSFRKKLSKFLASFLLSHDIPLPGLPGTRTLKLKETDKVSTSPESSI